MIPINSYNAKNISKDTAKSFLAVSPKKVVVSARLGYFAEAKNLSASNAAIHPDPAEVIACL